MKKNLFIILALTGFCTLVAFTPKETTKSTVTIKTDDDYCSGWSDGYKDGWCYGRGIGCLPPLVPLCPMLRLNEPNTYKAGYQRGFNQGQSDHNNQ
jgi:hypothetical protein